MYNVKIIETLLISMHLINIISSNYRKWRQKEFTGQKDGNFSHALRSRGLILLFCCGLAGKHRGEYRELK